MSRKAGASAIRQKVLTSNCETNTIHWAQTNGDAEFPEWSQALFFPRPVSKSSPNDDVARPADSVRLHQSKGTKLIRNSANWRGLHGIRRAIAHLTLQTAVFAMTVILAAVDVNAQVVASRNSDTADRAVQSNDRIVLALRKRPRLGTAFDRVYSFHVARGSLDTFVESLREEAEAFPVDSGAVMLLGMVELRRGNTGSAVSELLRASDLRSDDSTAAWYLGQALSKSGRLVEAAEALENALTRSPQKADLLEISKQLGRIYSRMGDSAKAMTVWKRLESQFPTDTRVYEQIAVILADEGEFESAYQHYAHLAQTERDPYRRVDMAIRAAELLVRLNRKDEAIARFERTLDEIKPGSWLASDVRRRIEQTFLATQDMQGLVSYYEQRLQTQTEDVDAMRRLAELLSQQGDSGTAEEWWARAISLAPSNVACRESLIDHLVAHGRHSAAVEQYRQLDVLKLITSDHLQRWGLLYLQDPELSTSDQRSKATVVWNRLLQLAPADAVNVVRVAELFRNSEIEQRALSLYSRAIELQPDEPQYREALGQYFHELGRKQDAVRAWSQMASGDRRTSHNLMQLADIYLLNGYQEEAVQTMITACGLEPEFSDILHCSRVLREAGQANVALQQLAKARNLAASPEDLRSLTREQIACDAASGVLTERIRELETQVAGSDRSNAETWMELARYQEAENRLPSACASLHQAVLLNPESAEVWRFAAETFEKSGLLMEATDAWRELSVRDRRSKRDALKQVAELELQLGRTREALQAARALVSESPGSTDSLRFLADVCQRVGQPQVAIEALRKAARLNPNDPETLTALGRALADQFQTAEATELHWQAFDNTEGFESRSSLIRTLVELTLRSGDVRDLALRLQQLAARSGSDDDFTIFLAMAHRQAGDVGKARQILSQLTSREAPSARGLQLLVDICEQQHDFQTAIELQQTLNSLEATPQGTGRLKSLMGKAGLTADPQLLTPRYESSRVPPGQSLEEIDTLLTRRSFSAAATLCRAQLQNAARDWNLLLRMGVIHLQQDQTTEAFDVFDRLRGLKPNLGDPVTRESSSTEGRQAVTTLDRCRIIKPFHQFLESSQASGDMQPSWQPRDLGEARVAAISAMARIDWKASETKPFLAELEATARRDAAQNIQTAWDWFVAVRSLQLDGIDVGPRLQAIVDLMQRVSDPSVNQLIILLYDSRNSASSNNKLSEPEVERLTTALDAVTESSPAWLFHSIDPGDLAVTISRSGGDRWITGYIDALTVKATLQLQQLAALRIALALQDPVAVEMCHGRIGEWSPLQPPATGHSSDWTASVNSSVIRFLVQTVQEHDLETGLAILTQRLVQCSRVYSDRLAATGPLSIRDLPPTRRVPLYTIQPSTFRTFVDPAEDACFSSDDLTLLINSVEVFQNAGSTDRLLDAVRRFREEATVEQAVVAEVALSHVHLLLGDESAAMTHLVRAAALDPSNQAFRYRLVRFCRKSGNEADALALLNTIEPAGHDPIRDHAHEALALAMSVGDLPRARRAAERLFGLRLDSDTQMELISDMERLGLAELATAVRARVRRSAQNETETLRALLQQHIDAGESSTAAQVAHQIVRISVPGRGDARAEAMKVLAQTNQLVALIQITKGHLKRAPDSVELHEQLAELYAFNGQSEEAQALTERIVSLQPDNLDSLMELARQHEQQGRLNHACDRYTQVLNRDPSRFSQDYFRLIRAFERVERLNDLVDLLIDADLRKQGRNVFALQQLIENLFRQRSSRAMAEKLFVATWQAFPEFRSHLVSIADDAVWQLPVMREYVLGEAIPSDRFRNAWQGVAESIQYQSAGRVAGTMTRLLRLMNSEQDMRQLLAAVETGLEQHPDWAAGRLYRVVLLARTGSTAEAKQYLAAALEDVDDMPGQVAWVTACELKSAGSQFLPAVVALLLHAGSIGVADPSSPYHHDPRRQLIDVYVQLDQPEHARSMLLDHIGRVGASHGTQTVDDVHQWNEAVLDAVEQMQSIGFPVDAILMLDRIRSLPQTDSSPESVLEQSIRKRLTVLQTRAIRAVHDASWSELLRWVTRTGNSGERHSVRIEFLLEADAGPLKSRRVRSVIEDVIKRHVMTDPAAARASLKHLTDSGQDVPPSVWILQVLVADAAGDSELMQQAFHRLRQFADSHNSRPPGDLVPDRTTAAGTGLSDKMALWLSARIALGTSAFHDIGQQLADVAERAARRAAHTELLVAMHRERGDLALRSDDKRAAAAEWSDLITDILGPAPAEDIGSLPPAFAELREKILSQPLPEQP